MLDLDLEVLIDACSSGGSSCLTSTTELQPAAGPHAAVAPAKFSTRRGTADNSTYAYERRFLDGEERRVVLLDSKQSTLNRVEDAIDLAAQFDESVSARIPTLRVTYRPDDGPLETYTDRTLPHRAFDGHLRAASIEGTPATSDPIYVSLRDARPADASALLRHAPGTLVFGGWDASRKARQGRWRSALVGEIIGFCTDPGEPADRRGGARVDPVAMQIALPPDEAKKVLDAQRHELSPKLVQKFEKEIAGQRKKGEPVLPSELGLGGIPPSLDELAGVACHRIVRSRVLSFAALRQTRFGLDPDPQRDAAARAALAALALHGIARADAELSLRANCDLVEAGPTTVRLDRRYGQFDELVPLSIDAGDALLEAAIAHLAEVTGVEWDGQVLEFVGNPAIVAAAQDVEPEDQTE